MNIVSFVRCCSWLILSVWLSAGAIASETAVSLGVLAYNGKPQAIERWEPTATYLSSEIDGFEFNVEPLTLEEFQQAVNKGALDFFLTNPGHYVRLEVEAGASRLATFRTRYHDRAMIHLSALVFTRKNSGIETLDDMRGRSFAAVRENAFGGFQLAQKAFQDAGVDALQELDMRWMGFPHADIVHAVMSGKADAGIVRAGVLEKMAEQGLVQLDQVQVLARKQHPHFPFLHSTELYPEWPFAWLPATDPDLAKLVALALLNMPDSHPAAQAANGAGWTIPLDYTRVHEVFRSLKLAPYAPSPLTLGDFWRSYWHWIVIVLTLTLLSMLAVLRTLAVNQRLVATQKALYQHQDLLEETVKERTDELLQANQELQQDILTRISTEKNLSNACDTLQGLYTIAIRADLTRDQRLQSILDLSRQFLGVKYALITQVGGDGTFEFCSASPEGQSLSLPLESSLAKLAIEESQVIFRQETEGWLTYIACPVKISGRSLCLFEFASPRVIGDGRSEQFLVETTEIQLRILRLIAYWMGNERVLAEVEEEGKARSDELLQRFTSVSPRESEVLNLLVAGESTKDIARTLDISPKTVELHRANLLKKTQAKSSLELVSMAVQAGLTP